MNRFPVLLLAEIQKDSPFQPATNLWRAVEIECLREKALPFLKESRRILDLGCGDGGIMRILRPHLSPEAVITGIDVDHEETKLAEQSGLYARVFCSSAEKMDIEDSSQDAIISNSVLEHIEKIDEVLAESSRVLKSGGFFVATVPGSGFHACLGGPWLGVSRERYLADIDKRLAHLRYWTAQEWRKRLIAVGIEEFQEFAYLDQAQTRRWELVSRLTGGLLYSLYTRRRQPLSIQRQWGLRNRVKLPPFAALLFARALSLGLGNPPLSSPCSCLLLIGRKK